MEPRVRIALSRITEPGAPGPHDYITMGGMYTNIKIREKIDDYNVAFKFAQPYSMFLDLIASLTVAGHMTEGWHAMGLWSPKHYMQQFHPKYTEQAKLDQQAKAAGFDNWASYFRNLSWYRAVASELLARLTSSR